MIGTATETHRWSRNLPSGRAAVRHASAGGVGGHRGAPPAGDALGRFGQIPLQTEHGRDVTHLTVAHVCQRCRPERGSAAGAGRRILPRIRVLGNKLRPWAAERGTRDVTRGPLTVSATAAWGPLRTPFACPPNLRGNAWNAADRPSTRDGAQMFGLNMHVMRASHVYQA